MGKHKKRKVEDEDLNAGVFKKALVTPTPSTGAPGMSVYNDSLSELNMNMDSGDDADSSDDEAASKVNKTTGAHILGDKHVSNAAPASGIVRGLANIEATKMEVDAATAVMANMASLFANASQMDRTNSHGHQQQHHEHLNQTNNDQHQHQQRHAVGEDVIQMQQQLQMLLQGSISSDSSHQQHEQNSVQDATTILLNLSSDPSILATVSHPPPPSMPTTASDQTPRKEKSQKKKKSKRDQQEHKHDQASEASGSTGNLGSVPTRTLEEQMQYDMAGSSDNPLHTKWMMATALKEKGIPYRTGTFSSQEDQTIRQTIREYVARHNMPEDAIKRWFENGNGRGRFEKNDLKALWVEIAVRLQTRPLLNIYLHVRRMFHPQNNIGQWTKEDDEKLVALYQKHKGQWTVIGQELGRMADSCRDRYRNHLKDQDTMKTGTWAPEEDEKLLGIMQELALQQGKATILESNHMWTLISEKMGGTRSRHQCRHRFSQTLQPRLERGEWTGPSSAAARAAASVAKETATNAKHARHPSAEESHAQSSSHTNQASFTAADELRVLTEALQGAIPNTSNENLLWTQAMTTASTETNGSNNGTIHNKDNNDDDHNNNVTANSNHEYDELAAAIAAAARLPNPGNIPKAPKGPIRRKGGLQQQLDVLKMIQEYGYTDHTEIKWAELAKQLRARVEESNTAQLAKIIQQHEQIESQMQLQLQQQHSQDVGKSHVSTSAAATAAVTHAMAAAVAAAQEENVQSLQKLPAANQLTRTFMSSRCKTEGYREMSLQEVVKAMIHDVEQRIQRRNARYAAASATAMMTGMEAVVATMSTSSASSSPTSGSATGLVQQQNMSEVAHHAALVTLSAQFPVWNAVKKGGAMVMAGSSASSGTQALSKDAATAVVVEASTSAQSTAATLESMPSNEREVFLQQQHDHDIAEKLLTAALSNSELIPTRSRSKMIKKERAGNAHQWTSGSSAYTSVVKSSEYLTDTSDESDVDE